MSLTSWDPRRTALLAMDCQNDICHARGAFTGPISDQLSKTPAVARIAGVLSAAREADVLVVHVRHIADADPRPDHDSRMFRGMRALNALVDGTWGAAILDEVTPSDGDLIIDKHRISAFAGTSLDRVLRQKGVDSLLLTGVTTSFVVEGTGRDAVDRGYRTGVVSDACACLSDESHEHSLRLLARLTEITDFDNVTAWLLEHARRLTTQPTEETR